MTGTWEKIYGARRRALDRKLLASMEREIANEEKMRSRQKAGIEFPTDAPCPNDGERARIARAFGRSP